MGHKLAAIDLGTNSVLLSVIEVPAGERGGTRFEFRSLHEEARVTRLGRGVDESGVLGPDAIERTLACLRDYRGLCVDYGCDAVRIVGTSAVRDARNGREFAETLEKELGWRLEIVSGPREAELTFRGALVGIEATGRVFVFDIGGGSTEFILGAHGQPDDAPLAFAKSLDVGSVRMFERACLADPPTPGELDDLSRRLDTEVARLGDPKTLGPIDHVIGVAGTVTSLAALTLGLDHYERSVVHGSRVHARALEETVERLARLSIDERRLLTSLEKGRADVIAVGGYWLVAILRWLERSGSWRSDSLIVSDRGVRFGLLAEMVAAT